MAMKRKTYGFLIKLFPYSEDAFHLYDVQGRMAMSPSGLGEF
jgi:hypothetical protein